MLTSIKNCVIGSTIDICGTPRVITMRVWSKGMVTLSFEDIAPITIGANDEVILVADRPKAVAFIPVDGEEYVCGVTAGSPRPANEFVSGYYQGPVCKECHRDFMTYGCD